MTSNITITFFCIIKNESAIIERCLSSLLSVVDYFVITDTGSTDNTVNIVESFLQVNKKKGVVYHDEWKNFGYNRSLSVKNAQDWLDKQKINKSTNFLLTIDADMKIQVENDFNKNDLGKFPVWMLRQKTPNLVYYNTRLIRSDCVVTCVGVTHEYWSTKLNDEDISPLKFESLWCEDVGDGGSKSDKFSRDIRLLTQGLIDEPNNVRYLFYLAQSYADSNDYMNAIIWYKKRIDAGGWFEEIFISFVKLGELYMKINEPEKALDAWACGYNYNPYRTESLIRMVHYYRNKGRNQIALVYLRQIAKMDYPKDQVLFIEHNVYDYGFFEECSINCGYAGNRLCGLHACNYLIFKRDSPVNVRQTALQNIFFYLNPFNWHSKQLLEFTDINKDIWKSSSSSFYMHNKNVQGVVRAVNYSINDKFEYTIRDPHQVVRTKNFWAHLKKDDHKLYFKSCYELICTCPTIRTSHISGLEDLKIVQCGSKLLGLATSFEYGVHNHPSIVIVHIEPDKSGKMTIPKVVATTFNNHLCQKNWAPFYWQQKFLAIYGHYPFTLLELNPDTGDSKIVLSKMPPYDLSNIRGSASPIQMNNGDWLVLVHEVVVKNTRKYYHRILKYSPTWDLIDISHPFYFKKLFVEFSLSMFLDKDMVYIMFSTEDNTTEMVSIKYDNIQWVPRDIKLWIKNNI